jgi:hypothetical protein
MTSFFGCDISNDGKTENQIIDLKSAMETFEILTPKRSPYPLIRVGGSGDGAYLIPDDLSQVSHCLSPGVNNFKHFEDELTTRYGINCDMYDASSDVNKLTTPLIEGKQTFEKLWLDIDNKPDSISIKQWLASKSADSGDCILQIDIEGAEYRNLLGADSKDLARFRIIVIELHKMASGFARPMVFNKVIRPFFKKLDENFTCVHAHPNNVLGMYKPQNLQVAIPRILELTFLRKDRFTDDGNKSSPVSLPHPLDITNVLGKPPLHLGQEWMKSPRQLKSRARMMNDWLDYFQHHSQTKNFRKLIAAQAKYAIKKQFT